MKMGVIPEREIDSDVDGLSSLESPDEEYGLRNYNPNKVFDSMQAEQRQHLWDLRAQICRLPVTEKHQAYRT